MNTIFQSTVFRLVSKLKTYIIVGRSWCARALYKRGAHQSKGARQVVHKFLYAHFSVFTTMDTVLVGFNVSNHLKPTNENFVVDFIFEDININKQINPNESNGAKFNNKSSCPKKHRCFTTYIRLYHSY